MPQIVTVEVTQTVAPAPSALQATGLMVTQGGTNTTNGTRTILTAEADLAAILGTAKAISSLSWASNVVTVTTSAPHGWPSGQSFLVTIAGASPSGYNVTGVVGTVTGASTLTYPLTPNPGSNTVPGTVAPVAIAELTSMVDTFFAQGSGLAVYVLELGVANVATGVTALDTYITANPEQNYSYLIPRAWDADSGFLSLLADFEATTSKAYFFVTSTLGTYSNYTSAMKCAFVMVESPTKPATEFSVAAPFYVTLNYAPSSTNQVPPTQYAYLYGVTAYPVAGNNATLTALLAASVNYVGTAAEGGVSTAMLLRGTLMDGNPFNYWYSVDWVQINVALDLANEIINGSNNTQAPLYYNQDGINRLQARAQATMNRGIGYGLVLSPVTVEAETFADWTTANPSSYAEGFYGGLSVEYTPARGFTTIEFNVNVTNLLAA